MPKKAIVSVINDLSTDQRVHRTCMTLHKLGFEVTLVGRALNSSLPLTERSYKTKRMYLLFTRNFPFYAFYNLRLFLYLLFHRADVLVANDLDTLLPNYIASKLKRSALVYDTHELFCEVPELQNNPGKKRFWKRIEKYIFPKLKNVITVNESIAELYSKEYNVNITVARNIPAARKTSAPERSKLELNLPTDKKIILLQGAGINVDRGSEEAVEAMQYMEEAVLYIIGSGDVLDILKQKVSTLKLEARVKFIARLPFEELLQYTRHADIGLTLDKDTNINYRFSLPNKIFDYIHSGVPVLASSLAEIKKIYKQYDIGLMTESHDPKHIADKMKTMLDETLKNKWKENCKLAAIELCWEKEEEQLLKIFSPLA